VPKTAVFGHTILCDSVYVDKDSGKPILAGVYSGDVALSAMPARLRCAIYSEFLPPTDGKHYVELKFYLGKKQMAGATLEFGDTHVGTPALLIIPQFEMGIDVPIDIEIRAIANGGRALTILRKKVVLREKPSTLPPAG
jgi:hypothetical protein